MSGSFGADTTTDELLHDVDLSGRRMLVTGVSSGLGVETARALLARGAQVIGAARDLAKARAALLQAGIEGDKASGLRLIELDLAALESVRRCAVEIIDTCDRLDLIVGNAGVMETPFGKTIDGFETQFGTNHLGHFVLVNRLATLLHQGGRVVMVASAGHRFSDVDLEDPNFDRGDYTPTSAYGRSKTSNILFSVEFDRRHKERSVRAAAVHPGVIRTELARHLDPVLIEQRIKSLRIKTTAQGAATSIWAGVVAPADLVGGCYCEDCHVADIAKDMGFGPGVRPYAIDAERAKALWVKSEEMVGESFP